MEKFYSKVQPGHLLHIVYRLQDFQGERWDIIPPDMGLQCSALKFNAGRTFRAHKHIEKDMGADKRVTEEGWIVIKGRVKAVFYDTDDTIIAQPVLYEGDACFSLGGVHNYKIMSEPFYAYEVKLGPYRGQAEDKIFIE